MDLGPAGGAHVLVATDVDVERLWALIEAAFAQVSAHVREQ
jgi:hypothetical protein